MSSLADAPRGLTGNLLKWIAIGCMLVDHIAWGFLPADSPLGFGMHLIGRITAPVMCFLLAEGYHHTRDIRRYALRLALFALLSWPAFSFFETGVLFPPLLNFGMIWTLLLGLLALLSCDRDWDPVEKLLAVLVCVLLSLLGDWPVFGILYILAFGLNRGDRRRQMLWFAAISIVMVGYDVLRRLAQGSDWWIGLMQLGVFLALPLLYRYNGQRGGQPWMKWVFYAFYPLHLLLLAGVKFVLC